MFADAGIGKLEFQALAGNLAVGSLVCNLGARREGTLIGHTLSGGKPKDVWLYGLSREQFMGGAGGGPRLTRPKESNVVSIEQHE